MNKVDELKVALSRAEAEVSKLKSEIHRIQFDCECHVWDYPEGKYDPKITPGYMARNYMGARPGYEPPDVWVPPKTEPRWVRICKLCKFEHVTMNVTPVTTQKPNWG